MEVAGKRAFATRGQMRLSAEVEAPGAASRVQPLFNLVDRLRSSASSFVFALAIQRRHEFVAGSPRGVPLYRPAARAIRLVTAGRGLGEEGASVSLSSAPGSR